MKSEKKKKKKEKERNCIENIEDRKGPGFFFFIFSSQRQSENQKEMHTPIQNKAQA